MGTLAKHLPNAKFCLGEIVQPYFRKNTKNKGFFEFLLRRNQVGKDVFLLKKSFPQKRSAYLRPLRPRFGFVATFLGFAEL